MRKHTENQLLCAFTQKAQYLKTQVVQVTLEPPKEKSWILKIGLVWS